MNKILVIHSGGLDSTCLLYKAIREVGKENVYALSFEYGQKHSCELEQAMWHHAHIWGKGAIQHAHVLNITELFAFDKSSTLIKGNGGIEHGKTYDEILAEKPGTVDTFVAYRNGTLLSIATTVAYSLGCDIVAYGAHADDAAGAAYPDCTPGFIKAQGDAMAQGTGGRVKLWAPFSSVNKVHVVMQGLQVGMTREELSHTHSCYEGVKGGCGTCATCLDARKALDFWEYSRDIKQDGVSF